jgi:hypothetical protein
MLEQFEALVASQKPAAKHWEPVTDYSFEARSAIEGPHARLIKQTFNPRRVIDVGCGPRHLVNMLRIEHVKALGVDVNDHWQPDFVADITLRDGVAGVLHGDLVVCREVLEHLTIKHLRVAVTNICTLSNRYVYITTRFAKNPQHLLDVDTSDDLDPTHITMLNQDLLRLLVVIEGFKRRADLEQAMDWKQLNRVLVYERC